MSDMSMPASIAARQAGPAFGGQTYLPFICANVSLSIITAELFRIPLVNANGVTIRIENHGHATHGRGHRFDPELYLVRFQMSDGLVKVFHFQRGAAAVGARFPAGSGADGERVRAEFVFR